MYVFLSDNKFCLEKSLDSITIGHWNLIDDPFWAISQPFESWRLNANKIKYKLV